MLRLTAFPAAARREGALTPRRGAAVRQLPGVPASNITCRWDNLSKERIEVPVHLQCCCRSGFCWT